MEANEGTSAALRSVAVVAGECCGCPTAAYAPCSTPCRDKSVLPVVGRFVGLYRPQDFDPLAETVPPRYAYESDDSDEFNPFPDQARPTRTQSLKNVRVTIDLAEQTSNGATNTLIIATGDAGKAWATRAELGQQVGRVVVENVQVCSISPLTMVYHYLYRLWLPGWYGLSAFMG